MEKKKTCVVVFVEFSNEQEAGTAVVGELYKGIETGIQQGLITLCLDLLHSDPQLQDDSLSVGDFL